MDRFFRTQPPPRKSTVRLGTHAHSLKEINQTEKRQQAVAKGAASLTATSQSEFFGGVSKEEAIAVFEATSSVPWSRAFRTVTGMPSRLVFDP